jgi:hypothetical protein
MNQLVVLITVILLPGFFATIISDKVRPLLVDAWSYILLPLADDRLSMEYCFSYSIRHCIVDSPENLE